MNGLNIKEQQKLAAKEDLGTEVHILGVDEKPLYYVDKTTGDEKPVTITVAGTNSSRFREIEERQRKRKIKPKDLTGARMHHDGIEKAAFCTLAWQGVINDEGEPFDCNFQNAKEVYKSIPSVYQQIIEAMGDAERFFGSTSPDS